MHNLILASSSPYRRQLLSKLGLNFQCHSPAIDETPLADETAPQLALRLAIEKAQAVAEQFPSAIIIGSDQVASVNNQILNKPGNHDNAKLQLLSCSGHTTTFYTGLALLNSDTGALHTAVEPFTAHFRKLSIEAIENYLQREQPYDCAGSFKVEGLGIALFERLEGDDPNSLIGLPLIQLINLLKKEGVEVI